MRNLPFDTCQTCEFFANIFQVVLYFTYVDGNCFVFVRMPITDKDYFFYKPC